MNSFKSSAELKGMAKEQLFGKYGTAIGASLLISLIMTSMVFALEIFNTVITGGVFTAPQLIIYYLISFIISLFGGILASGEAFFFLKITCRQPVSVSDIFYGFKVYPDKALFIQFVLSLVSSVCQIPMMIFYALYFRNPQNAVYMLFMSVFAVAGTAVMVVINLMLSQAFYLLQDFPQYTAKEVLNMSCQIMKGHKGRLFYISVSFLPLYFLGLFSCCIALLWITPYVNTVMANFYMDLMRNRHS